MECLVVDPENSQGQRTDGFYRRVIEHAVAYFGSRVLYPSRPAPSVDNALQLSRAGCAKAAHAAIEADAEKFEATAEEWGYRIGSQIYDAYVAGKLAPRGIRRLFLTHLDEPGIARRVCGTVISKLRSIARPQARAAHA
jgi:hypothetical protein